MLSLGYIKQKKFPAIVGDRTFVRKFEFCRNNPLFLDYLATKTSFEIIKPDCCRVGFDFKLFICLSHLNTKLTGQRRPE